METELPPVIWLLAIALSVVVGAVAAFRLSDGGGSDEVSPGARVAVQRVVLVIAGGVGVAAATLAALALLLYCFESVFL